MEEENKDEIKEQKPETPVDGEKKDEAGKQPDTTTKDPLDEIKNAYEAKLEEEKKKAEALEAKIAKREAVIADLLNGEAKESMPTAFEKIVERRNRQRKF